MKIRSTRDLAAAVRGSRKDLGLSQADLAAQVGVSRAWINEVEAGKPSVEFGLILRLLDVLGLHLDLDQGSTRGGEPQLGGLVDLDLLLDEYRQR